MTSVTIVAGVTTLDGILEAGAIDHDDDVSVVDEPDLSVTIQTVAFVNPKRERPEAARILTIKPVTYPASRRVGRLLEKRQ